MKKGSILFKSKTNSLTANALLSITFVVLLPLIACTVMFTHDFLYPPVGGEYRLALDLLSLVLIWLIVLLLVQRIVSGIRESLHDFAVSIAQKQLTPVQPNFPELNPVLDEIKRYANDLEQSNKQLHEAQTLLTNIIEGIDEGFYVLNQNFEFTFINKKMLDFIGRDREELLNKSIWECFPNLVGGTYYQQLVKGMSERQPLAWEMCWTENKSLSFKVYPFLDGISVFSQDVSFHKALEANAVELTSIVQNASIAIIGLSAEGQIISWNPGAVKLFGYNLDEVSGIHLFDLITPVSEALFKQIRTNISQGVPVPAFESVAINKHGAEINSLVDLSYIRNPQGQIVRISVVISDITSVVRSKKEIARLDRLNLIGQMAAGISHEVRNPLTTIRGFLQMLGAKNELTAYHDYFELMISELDRANAMITEFLSLSKDKPLNLEYANPNEIIQKLFPIVQADAFRSSKDIVVELDNKQEILIDKNEVRQLLLNLIRNALDASPKGSKVVVRTREEQQQVVIEVQDFGSGIPAHVLSKLGTPFLTTKENGTGLGLSICYEIAARHNAQITLETDTSGTTFYVHFPVCEN